MVPGMVPVKNGDAHNNAKLCLHSPQEAGEKLECGFSDFTLFAIKFNFRPHTTRDSLASISPGAG